MQILFSYGNQSVYQEKRLTLLNFLLPGLITMGFMFLAMIAVFIQIKKYKTILIQILILLILEAFAIKWQVEFLNWSIKNNNLLDSIPIIVGIILVLFVFGKLLINVKTIKSGNK
jgi:hypothetical protein